MAIARLHDSAKILRFGGESSRPKIKLGTINIWSYIYIINH